ncbi:MAG TPA: sugar ABC transporter permease [Firmicutes bacterium]|mgnify:FL=1|jgi:ABC-type sugar transport system permease subunit|nr:sugar ABC transporter permease [Bacillota bacterium]
MWETLRKHRHPYLFIAPYLILFLVFQLVPTIATVYYSFTEWNGLRPPRWIGWRNYQLMMNDYMFSNAIQNTFRYWIVGAIGIMGLSLLIAVLLNSKVLRSKQFFKTSTFLPYVCASVAMGLIFRMLFEEHAGLVNEVIVSLGGSRIPWLTTSAYAWIPVVILFIWRLTPWFTMIILSGLLNISDEYYEAATVDGASGWQQFLRITLPLLNNILFFCFITITVDAWRLFNESHILSGPGTSNTSLFELMYTSAFTNFKLGYGSALGVVLIVILLGISLIQFMVRRRTGEI